MMHHKRYRTQIADQFRAYTGRSHVVFTGRGATAIWAALKAFGFSDQPVLIPANTCYIVLWAVILSGNRPILVDIDPTTGMITADSLSACGVEHPAAVIACHLYGLPAPMPEIVAWANARGAKVIEDAAQAVIAPGSKIGSWGDCSIFSFGSGKIVDVGLRGALLCSDERLTAEIKRVLAPLPVWDEQLEGLQSQWLDIYWATHQRESENSQTADSYPKLFQDFHRIVLTNAPSGNFGPLAARFTENYLSRERSNRMIYATYYDDIADGVFRTLPRKKDDCMWRYPLLMPQKIRAELFQYLLNERYDVTQWYPSLQPMARALCPDIQQSPTSHADDFGNRIINFPLAYVSAMSNPIKIAQTITMYRKWKRL